MTPQAVVIESEKTAIRRTEKSRMKKKVSKIISTVIVYFAMFIIGILAIPVCVFLVLIKIIWAITDKIVRKLE